MKKTMLTSSRHLVVEDSSGNIVPREGGRGGGGTLGSCAIIYHICVSRRQVRQGLGLTK